MERWAKGKVLLAFHIILPFFSSKHKILLLVNGFSGCQQQNEPYYITTAILGPKDKPVKQIYCEA